MLKLLQIYSFIILFIYIHLCSASRQIYTSTVVKSKAVTTLVPSSCVQVDATLPPCRHIRYLRLPKLPALSFQGPVSEEVVPSWRTEGQIQTTPLSWGEYFGFYAPTVTITTTTLHLTTVEDPSVVVTFAVKGCRPLKLPMDLNRCPQEDTSTFAIEENLQTSTVASSIVATETLLPTKTMSAIINPSSTAYEELSYFPEDQANFQDNLNLLEPSPQERAENLHSQPTEALTSK